VGEPDLSAEGAPNRAFLLDARSNSADEITQAPQLWLNVSIAPLPLRRFDRSG
jgi:hypothetical protein